jgi:hypothetical protein
VAAPRERLIQKINWFDIRRISDNNKFIQTRQAAARLRVLAMEECPVDTGHMKSQHKLVHLGGTDHGVLVDTDYAMFVFDGAPRYQRRTPNRWLYRALDRLKAEIRVS